jgi:hypothetical protein
MVFGIDVGPILFVNHDACSKFEYKYPADIPKTEPTASETDYIHWIGIVQRGGCPFDQKVFMMQQAGFKTVLVFNHRGEAGDVTVRMSPHTFGDEIESSSAFLTRNEGVEIVNRIINSKQRYEMATLQAFDPIWISKELLWSGLVDMCVLLLLVIVTGTAFFIFGLTINLGHNLVIHGHFYLYETIHEASTLILNGEPVTVPPKLEKITFPTRILDEKDFVNEWSCGGLKGHENCPICIEEFVAGDTVRELPCRHIFHACWYQFVNLVLIHGY